MLNIKLIYKIIGSLLFLEAVFLLICLGISLFYMEDDMLAFLLSFIIIIIGGILFRYAGRNATNTLGRRDAYLLVTLTWIIFSLFGCLPFLASGYVSSPTDAFFETMSGFTTTGASVIDDVERLPHALLFWRSLTQWIGGLGIVFFTIAIIPSLVGGNMKVF
ncbi:MAG: TrkH family potassium uptake protein, partial [Prevotella sp.]|nr:TrkH family potassium uptake protein [Prevotella sp.]